MNAVVGNESTSGRELSPVPVALGVTSVPSVDGLVDAEPDGLTEGVGVPPDPFPPHPEAISTRTSGSMAASFGLEADTRGPPPANGPSPSPMFDPQEEPYRADSRGGARPYGTPPKSRLPAPRIGAVRFFLGVEHGGW